MAAQIRSATVLDLKMVIFAVNDVDRGSENVGTTAALMPPEVINSGGGTAYG